MSHPLTRIDAEKDKLQDLSVNVATINKVVTAAAEALTALETFLQKEMIYKYPFGV